MKNNTSFRFGFILIVCLITCISENNAQTQFSKKNFGIRIGLNAVSITSYKVYQADEILTNSSFTNQNGYLITGFARFNINKIFFQPELSWNDYRRTCSFALPIENSTDYYPSVDLNIHSQTANANFLVGYNIVHDYPFLFGIFAGASAIGTYRTDYSIDAYKKYLKPNLLVNYSGILGCSINISKIYFDLRYEMTVPITNFNLNEISDFPENYQNISIRRTEAILSFSFGVMF